jgi:hypothetical protein
MKRPKIKAIETRYNGILFRSRLEARWAVFFAAAGIDYEYEPERVALPGGGTYLPDFRTNGSGYAEVKGTEENLDKPYLMRAASVLGHLTVLGPVPNCTQGLPGRAVLLARTDGPPLLHASWFDYRPRGAAASKILKGYGGPWLTVPVQPGPCTGHCPYDAARSARFEHGQSGRV